MSKTDQGLLVRVVERADRGVPEAARPLQGGQAEARRADLPPDRARRRRTTPSGHGGGEVARSVITHADRPAPASGGGIRDQLHDRPARQPDLPGRPPPPAAARRRPRGVRRARLPPDVDERPGRGGRGHQAGPLPALRVEAGALPRAARRRRRPPARRHRQGDGGGRRAPASRWSRASPPTSGSSPSTRPPSRCSSVAAPAATRSSPPMPAGSRRPSPTRSRRSSTSRASPDDERAACSPTASSGWPRAPAATGCSTDTRATPTPSRPASPSSPGPASRCHPGRARGPGQR